MEHTPGTLTPSPTAAATPPAHGKPPLRLASEDTIQGFRRTADPLHTAPSAAQVQPSAGQLMSRQSPPARSKSTLVAGEQDQDARSVGTRAAPARQGVTIAVPGPAAASRRSKISIGRIDVQVNNTPAAVDVSPAPAVPAVHSNFLEVRYLNRFSLKP